MLSFLGSQFSVILKELIILSLNGAFFLGKRG
uniref:Uncharacterized protein n=1 Tax=Arundo donax TaxID=35708 RepID=A0A0A9AEP8_ARUDO